MPYVKKLIPYKKKQAQLSKKKKTYVKKSSKPRMISPFTLHSGRMVISPRFFTRLQCSFQGVTAAASGATGFATINLNEFNMPFTTSAAVSTMPINGTDASSISMQYNGFSALQALYSGYRIHASKLKIKCQTTVTGDTANVWCFPYSELANPTFDSTPVLSHNASGFRGYKSMIVSSGNALNGSPQIELFAKTREVLGFSKAQYDCQPSTGYASAPPGALQTRWQVNYATMDGQALTGQLLWEFTLECYIELSDPLQPTN